MNPMTWIADVQVMEPGKRVAPGSVLIRNGKIDSIELTTAHTPPGAVRVEGHGRLLTPGLIDLHTHGIHEYLYERSPEDILRGSAILPRYGTTCALPTLYKVLSRNDLTRLGQLADALDQVQTVRFPGFHLEGPFLALPGAGADTLPGDLKLLQDLYDACRGYVAAMAVSPDTPNILPVIEWLVEQGVLPLITHTRATTAQALAAIDAGACHATHFYDVFPLPVETEPGVRPAGMLEAALADPRVSVDFIADGVHVEPLAIKAALAAKGFEGIILITDSNIGAGLPPGVYDTPWGYPVRVGDAARIESPGSPIHNGLAGSALTMDRGMRNLLQWLAGGNAPANRRGDGRHVPLSHEQVWAMGTSNPARLLRIPGGVIRAGADADLVLWDNDLTAAVTWVGGQTVWEKK